MVVVPGKYKIQIDVDTAEITVNEKLNNITVEEAKEFSEQLQAAVDIAKHYDAVATKVRQLEAIERAKSVSITREPRRKIPKEDHQQIFVRYRVEKESPKVIAVEYHVTDQAVINVAKTWAKENPGLAEELLQT